MDAQSVKNADTAGSKGYDAGKKVSGIKRHIAVDTQGLPHAIALTTADMTDRQGALQAFKRCKGALGQVQSVLADGGYTGEPFAQGVREILGEQVTVQVAKSAANCTHSKSCPNAGWWSAALPGWTRTGGCGRTASGGSTPACSSCIWHSWHSCSEDCEHVLKNDSVSSADRELVYLAAQRSRQPPTAPPDSMTSGHPGSSCLRPSSGFRRTCVPIRRDSPAKD